MTETTARTPPKAPPPLTLRAARPRAVRLRKAAIQAAVVLAAAVLAGALAWAFVVRPELRGRLRPDAAPETTAEAARPAELVSAQPASYDRLPPPKPLFGRDAPNAGPSDAPPAAASRQAAARGPSLAERAAQSDLFFAQATPQVAAEPPARDAAPASRPRPARPDADYGAVYNGHALLRPLSPFELKAGSILPAALLTAVDTERAGPVTAVVVRNVFDSVSGRYLLVPQGARLIGRQDGDSAYGERRAFIAWTRLILPDGRSVVLSDAPGVDAQGATGVRGRVDRRLGALATATLFSGAITTLGQAARDRNGGDRGWLGDAGDAAAITAARTGGRLVDRELQVRPSIRLDAGAPVRVLLTRDLILEPIRP